MSTQECPTTHAGLLNTPVLTISLGCVCGVQERITALTARRYVAAEWATVVPSLADAKVTSLVFDPLFDAGGSDAAVSTMASALAVKPKADDAPAEVSVKVTYEPVPFCAHHEHYLEESVEPRKSGASCNLCEGEGVCVYTCEECDFDICKPCFSMAEDTSAVFTTHHKHPINLTPDAMRASHRLCDVCRVSCTVCPVYCCDVCGFDICTKCWDGSKKLGKEVGAGYSIIFVLC